MRWTQQLIRTEKPDSPHPILERAALMRTLPGGRHVWLPMGYRIIQKLRRLVEELYAPFAPVPCHAGPDPRDWWEGIFPLIRSYRQLPLNLAQLNLPASMDLWSIHAHTSDLTASYDRIRADADLWPRLGLEPTIVETLDGHSSVVEHPHGDYPFVVSDRGNYAATIAATRLPDRPWSFGTDARNPLQTIPTPGATTIEQVCAAMKVPPRRVLKTLVYRARYAAGDILPQSNLANPRWLAAVVRGDHALNEHKLLQAARQIFHIDTLDPEVDDAMRAVWSIGFVGPDLATRRPDTVVVIDPDAAGAEDHVAGANRPDHHVMHFNWFRDAGDLLADPNKVAVVDIRNPVEGDPSPRGDGGRLTKRRGIELARCHQLPAPEGVLYTDADGQQQAPLVIAASLRLENIVRAIAERSNDPHGLIWPARIAPASVVITPVQYQGATREAADQLHRQLRDAGIDVILDDRADLRAGEKFADADLLGFPLRLTVGERGLASGQVELKPRAATQPQSIPIDNAVEGIRKLLHEAMASHS